MGNVPLGNYDGLPVPSQFQSLLDLHKSTMESRPDVNSLEEAEKLWIISVQDNHYPEIIFF